MEHIDLSAYYFPTRIMLVDDNERFLENVGAKLQQLYQVTYLSDPHQAVDVLEQAFEHQCQCFDQLQQNMDFDFDEAELTEKLHLLPSLDWQELMRTSERYDFYGVVLVDYAMPTMNGFDFCRKIHGLPVKKIILTGEAGHETAVDAFNDGLIDGFIVKDSATMFQQLTDVIANSQTRYFADQHYPYMTRLPNMLPTSPNREQYIRLINDVFSGHHITEYYLIDGLGSYLFINREGRKIWLAIRSQQQLEMYYDLALNAQADEQLLSCLRSYQYFPFLTTETDAQQPIENWWQYLQPIERFDRDGEYYFAVIHDV